MAQDFQSYPYSDPSSQYPTHDQYQPYPNPNVYPNPPPQGQFYPPVGGFAEQAMLNAASDFIYGSAPPGGWFDLSNLKNYFNVNHDYVKKKFKILLAPFFHKSWHPKSNVPAQDENAADLYLPAMAFVTYILIEGLSLGIVHKFHPEQLGRTATKALALMILEVICLRFGISWFNTSQTSEPLKLLPLLAYCGYIFIGLVLNAGIGLGTGRLGYYIASFYTGLCMCNFMIKTLRVLIPDFTNSSRSTFIVLMGLLQFSLVYLLGIPPPEWERPELGTQ